MVRKIAALGLAFAVSLPLFAQSEKTDMRQLAADLQQALGANAVEVEVHDRQARVPVGHRGELTAEALLEAMNRERANAGLAPLRLNTKLTAAAHDRMHDLFAKHYFDHVSPDGIDPFSWVDKRGYDYREIGENLACGFPTAGSIVDGWMHSSAHRENVLGAAFNEAGIAIAPGSPRRPYAGPTVVALYGAQ